MCICVGFFSCDIQQKEQLTIGSVCLRACAYVQYLLCMYSGPHTEQKRSVARGLLPLSQACHLAQKQILPSFSTLLPHFSFFPPCAWFHIILSHVPSHTYHMRTNTAHKPKFNIVSQRYVFLTWSKTDHINVKNNVTTTQNTFQCNLLCSFGYVMYRTGLDPFYCYSISNF